MGGATSYWPPSKEATRETYFDIGSVTKAVVTTTLYALGVDKGEISLEESVQDYLAPLSVTGFGKLQIAELLSHSAGLIGWLPLYQELEGRNLLEYFKENEKRILIRAPRQKAEYSDLGFMLLGLILNEKYGDWYAVFKGRVLDELGLGEVSFQVPSGKSVAATEYCLHRKRLLSGEVFDENCWALGGRATHAGLFATARGLSGFCREWLRAVKGDSKWLTQKTAQKFTTRAGLVMGSDWCLGWDGKSEKNSTAGTKLSKNAFGHLGYTGTSLWLDPTVDGYVIFLTNRVHPSRYDNRIRGIRPELHDRIADYWMV